MNRKRKHQALSALAFGATLFLAGLIFQDELYRSLGSGLLGGMTYFTASWFLTPTPASDDQDE